MALDLDRHGVALIGPVPRGLPLPVLPAPELIGPFLTSDLHALVDRVSTIATPLLDRAMDAGLVHRRDPAVLAEFPMAPVIRDSLNQAKPRPQTAYYAEVSGGIQRTFPAFQLTPTQPRCFFHW